MIKGRGWRIADIIKSCRNLAEAAADGDMLAAEALSRYSARPGGAKGYGGRASKPFDVDAAAALLGSGVPVLEACGHMGVSYHTFRKRLGEAGIRY